MKFEIYRTKSVLLPYNKKSMATVTFMYRSIRDQSNLTLRLRFKDETIGGKTKVFISKDFWDSYLNPKTKKKKKTFDPEIMNEVKRIEGELKGLEHHILTEFNKEIVTDHIDKNWLKVVVDGFYNKDKSDFSIPKSLVSFIDYYVEQHPKLTVTQKKKYVTIKNKMKRFEVTRGEQTLIPEMGLEWLNDFSKFYDDNSYKQNTKHRELGTIKTFCRFAKVKGIQLHREFDLLRVEKGESINIHLSFDELDKIEQTEVRGDQLQTAKDWLLISCYTGQRISDFMRFDKSMIETEGDVKYLEFTQKKTGKDISIPIPEGGKLDTILKRYNGGFPERMREQTYNDLIKDVCELAEINEMTRGRKRDVVGVDAKGRKIHRDVEGLYPKYELVTSHIGRRSFGSNYYGEMDVSYIRNITGHSTDKMFLDSYMKKAPRTMGKAMIDKLR